MIGGIMVQESKMVESLIDFTEQLNIDGKDGIVNDCKAVKDGNKTINEVYADNFPVLDAISKHEKAIAAEEKKQEARFLNESLLELKLIKGKEFEDLLAYCFLSSDNISISFERVNNTIELVGNIYHTDSNTGSRTNIASSWTVNHQMKGAFDRIELGNPVTGLDSSINEAIKVMAKSFNIAYWEQDDGEFFLTTIKNKKIMSCESNGAIALEIMYIITICVIAVSVLLLLH